MHFLYVINLITQKKEKYRKGEFKVFERGSIGVTQSDGGYVCCSLNCSLIFFFTLVMWLGWNLTHVMHIWSHGIHTYQSYVALNFRSKRQTGYFLSHSVTHSNLYYECYLNIEVRHWIILYVLSSMLYQILALTFAINSPNCEFNYCFSCVMFLIQDSW